ncbi:MAG TPA: PKD domain-containing protein [Panacibacter sp.]|nr:PKD domain-containing protein [Panacibacter sp.]HNP45264.1 PKD domain-containing protein [Panacibacter sp.]
MRKLLPVAALLMLAAITGGAVVLYQRYEQADQENEKRMMLTGENEGSGKYDKQYMLEEMYKQWEQMMRDPATGKVPRDKLFAAWQYTKMMQEKQSHAPGVSGLVWVNRGPTNVGGRTRTIMISPGDATGNTGFAGSVGGGLWKSTNLKSTTPSWQPVNDFLATLSISSLTYDPVNTNTYYAGTGEGFGNSDAASGMGIFKSADAGSTWALLPATMTNDFSTVSKVIVTSLGHVYAATNTGVFRSKDQGASWEKVLVGHFGDIEVTTAGTFFASGFNGNNNLSKSTTGDLGSWTNLCTASVGLPSTGISRIETAVAPSDANQVYTAFFMDTTVIGTGVTKKMAIYSSTNNGVSFSRVGRPKDIDGGITPYDYTNTQGWYDLILKVDPTNSKAVYTGGVNLFKTTNGGTSWTQISHWYGGFNKQYVHADQHGIEFEGTNGAVAYFTNDGGIFQTKNGSVAIPVITEINTSYTVTQFYATAGHPDAISNYFLAGAQDNGTQKFTLPGLAATVDASGGDGAYCNIDEADPTYQFTQYVYNNYYRSNNGGESFDDAVTVPSTIQNTGRFINPSDFDENTQTLYAATNTGQYLRWTTATTSSTFKQVNVTGFAGQVSAVTASKVTPDLVYFGSGFGQIISVASASTVASPASPKILGTPVSAYVNCIWEDPANGDHLVIVYTNYGIKNIWETSNATSATPTWTAKDGDLPDMPVYWVLPSPTDSKTVLVATELGVYSTSNFDNAAPSWTPSSVGMANVRVTQIKLRPSDNMVYASTHGRGLFTTDFFASPIPAFTANTTAGYTGKAISYSDQSLKASSWQWDLNGDGSFDNSTQNPSFTYYNPGVYNVKLRINNDPSKEKTIPVTILPDKGTPYTTANGGDFETNPNDFAADHTGTSSFYRGNSAQPGKDGTNSGSFAWVIDPDNATYASNSTAYLYSPSYNCTATGNYTFSFYAKYAVENTWDGFRVEYSVDKGSNWQILGNVVQANWYDYSNTTTDRPFPAGENYFTSVNATAYTLKTYTTNAIQGNPSVAFRIVFKADPFVVDAGLAVDDISLAGPSNVVLPVTIISLTGINQGGNNLLNWKSATEQNSSQYEVERSFDGARFDKIGAVKSMNNATGAAYQYRDDISHTYVNNFYYRLKLVDKDGRYNYSNVVSVNVRGREEKITVLGNLTNAYINIVTPASLLQKPLQAEIYSMSGALVKRMTIKAVSSVEYVDKLAAGRYSIRFIQDGKAIQTAQFVKQ